MIFVDASAMVSIIAKEADAVALLKKLDSDEVTCSATSTWETMAALCRSYNFSPFAARAAVNEAIAHFGFTYVPIAATEADLAATAYERYGKGRHQAALNMGDCFAYACAKSNNAKLLFKGDDFTQTDILAA